MNTIELCNKCKNFKMLNKLIIKEIKEITHIIKRWQILNRNNYIILLINHKFEQKVINNKKFSNQKYDNNFKERKNKSK